MSEGSSANGKSCTINARQLQWLARQADYFQWLARQAGPIHSDKPRASMYLGPSVCTRLALMGVE